MSHIYRSSSVFLRVLNVIVSFLIEHRKAILSLIVALIAYKVAVSASAIALKAHYAWLVISQKGMALLQGATILLRAAFYAVTGQINRAKAALTAFNMLTKINPWTLLIAAAAAFVTWLVTMKTKLDAVAQAQRDLVKVKQEAATKMVQEEQSIKNLVAAAENERLSLDERKKAIDKLNSIIPNYNAQLDETSGKYRANKKALDDYLVSLRKKYELEGAREVLTEIATQRAKKIVEKDDLNHERANEQRIIDEARSYHPGTNISTTGTAPGFGGSFASTSGASQRIAIIDSDIRAIDRDIATLDRRRDYILGVYGDDMQREEIANLNQPEEEEGGGGGNYNPGSTDPAASDRFRTEQEWRERQEALTRIAYATGEKDYISHMQRMDEIAVEYYKRLLDRSDLSETERLSFEAQHAEARLKQQERFTAQSIEAEDAAYNEKVATLRQQYIDGQLSKEAYDLAIEQAEMEHQRTLISLTAEGSKERLAAEKRLSDLLIAEMERRRSETEKLEQRYAKMKQDYFGDNPAEAQAKYDDDLSALDVVYARELAAAGDNAAEKLRIEEAYQRAKLALQKKYGLLAEEDNRNRAQKMTDDITEWLNSDGGKAVTGALNTLVSGMSAMFTQLSSLMQAELEIQTAEINKRYDAEIDRAEGNSYMVKKLEKQKQAELAKAKNEANKKMFAMQVIQAVAQTAQNALSAYGSAAQVPVIGYILAPIAAAMAVAAGAIQIATIKKQQQASEAQGYSQGGFTPDGDADKPVGIVHAGEWVASQKLTRNPRVRPFLEALDQAQRNNTIGSLTPDAVSSLMPSTIAGTQSAIRQSPTTTPNVVVNVPPTTSDSGDLRETLKRLNARLDEPIGAVVTVSGDQGIARAQDEYAHLMRNKSPKSKR